MVRSRGGEYTGPVLRTGSLAIPILAFLLALCGLAAPGEAQYYQTRTYIDADGLPSPDVRSISQDADGVLWIATRGGLVTYDGSRWAPVDLGPGVPTARFDRLLRDAEQRLWVVERSSPHRVMKQTARAGWESLPVRGAPSSDHSLITAACLSRVGGRDLLLLGDSEGGLHLWDGVTWRVVGQPGSGDAPVLSVTAVGDRFLAAGAFGLVTFDANDPQPRVAPYPHQPRGLSRGVRYDPVTDRVWFVSSRELGWIGDEGLVTHAHRPGTDYPVIIEPDGRGGIYFGHPERVYHFNEADGVELIERRHGLVAEGTECLFLDREENLWIGGRRGMTKLVSRRFRNFTQEHGLLHDEVSAVAELRDGALVLGHPLGLSFLDRGGVSRLPLTQDGFRGRVMDLAQDRLGDVWAPCSFDGLARVGPDRSVTWYHATGRPALNGVLAEADSVLVGGFGGLFRVSGDSLSRVPIDWGIPADSVFIRRMARGADGSLLLACYREGLVTLRDGQVRRYSQPGRPGSTNIYTVLPLANGGIWVGAADGLYEVSGDTLALVGQGTPAGALAEVPVYLLFEEPDGAVWIGTDRGAMRWDGLERRQFSLLNGLVGQETNRAAGVVDRDGRVWVGTDRGVSCYRADLDRPSPIGPTVTLLESRIGGRVRDAYQPVSVAHGQGSLVQEFAAISFMDEDRLRIRSRLEGLETEWREHPAHTREVHYDRLGPGRYQLHMEVLDVEGRSSGIVHTAWTTVRKPFWVSGWFYVVAGLGLWGLGLAVASYAGQRRYSRRLETEVRERTAELSLSRAEIAEEKERLGITLSRIADGVVTADPEGRIVFLNPAAEALTGWPAEAAAGAPIELLFGPAPDGNGWPEAVAGWCEPSLAADGPGGTEVFAVATRGGVERWIEASAAPVGTDAERGGVVIAFRDVTERRRLDEEQARTQKLESLGVLAGGIAHDFNNLLTVVLGNLALLEPRKPPDAGRDADSIRDAQEATLRARSLTQQLLTFSRGGAPIRTVNHLGDILRQSVQLALSGSDLRCELTIDPGLRPVEVDEGQMTQVFNNLLINSRQALPDGGVIRVRAFNSDEGCAIKGCSQCVTVVVEDDGPGISEAHRSRIFDPYFTTKEGGTGLGLATVHSIVTRHGGVISLDSGGGSGARFRLVFPATSQDVEIDPPGVIPAPGVRGRILVMDDEDPVRQIVVRLLVHLGHEGVGVANGEAAVEAYREALAAGTPFDVVLMDLTVVGGMGGAEAAGHLLALDPTARLLVMSGYSNDPALAEPRRFGFVGRVEKPIDPEILRETLRDILRTSAVTR